MKRLGQKTRVHIFILGNPESPTSTIGVESQGGDVWGTASKAGGQRFLEALRSKSEFEVVENYQGPTIT